MEARSRENRMHVKVPNPKPFDGSRDSKGLENFIWISSGISKGPMLVIETKWWLPPCFLVETLRCGGGPALRTIRNQVISSNV